jgi:hypothetical protein
LKARLIRGKRHWFVVLDGSEAEKAQLREYLAGHPLRDDRCWGFVSESDAREAAGDFMTRLKSEEE